MNMTRFLSTWQGTQASNRWLLGTVAALSLVVLMQTIALLGRDQVVVLVPPELSAEVEVSRRQADQDYVKAWGLHLASLIGNVTPGNSHFIKESIGPLLAPEIHAEVTQIIERQLEQLRRDRVTLRFEPRRVVHVPSTDRVFVFGYSVTGAIGSTNEQRAKRTYEIGLEIDRHRPVITFLTTYQGEPRTSG